MDETARRPGGLTALAVLNFVIGGLMSLYFFSLLMFFAMTDEMVKQMDPASRERFERVKNDPNLHLVIVITTIVLGVGAALLIASGVGYLKQKRWGRVLGNLGALIGVGVAVLTSWEGVNIGS